MNILVTSAGRRVELVRAFMAAARALSPDAKVHAIDLDSDRSSACHVADHRTSSPRATDPAYGDFLRRHCEAHGISLVVPTLDTELDVLARLAPSMRDRGVEIVISSPELIAECADKIASAALFAGIGLDYPEVFDRDEIEFPCFVKPLAGSSSVGARRVGSADELSESERRDRTLMFMELVDPDLDEYTVDCYYDRHGHLRCAVPRKRLEVRAGEVSKAVTVRGPLHGLVLERMSNLKGARGCITLQVFADEVARRVIAIEINPRFGGGYPLSLEAGANFPAWLIDEYGTGSTPDYAAWRSGVAMLRYDAHVVTTLP